MRLHKGAEKPAKARAEARHAIIARTGANPVANRRGQAVKTIDEMLSLHLLTPAQHAEIGAWVARERTPEAIMRMPPPLWRALELASLLMNFDADVTQAPCLDGV